MRKTVLLLMAALILGFGTTGVAQTARPILKKITAFDLPGPGGKRFDYLTIDQDDHYLISAHLAASQTYVIDLRKEPSRRGRNEHSGAEGVEYVPELKKFYTSNAYDDTIGVVDLKQMKVIKKLNTESKPDGSTYAAPFHKLYVSDKRGKAEAIVDVQKDEIVGTLHFDSESPLDWSSKCAIHPANQTGCLTRVPYPAQPHFCSETSSSFTCSAAGFLEEASIGCMGPTHAKKKPSQVIGMKE